MTYEEQQAYKAMLAASERDQRGAAAGDSEKPVAAVAKSEADREVCGTDTGPQSAPHPDLLRGIALGIEAAAKRADGRHRYEVARDIRSLNPADIAAKNPTAGKFPEHKYGEFDAERNRAHEQVGAEEARRKVKEKHPGAFVSYSMTLRMYHIYRVRHPSIASDLLGSGPTEEAAWIDAAGRV